MALCPKQSQLSSQTCRAHVPLLSCVPCAHYLTPPPKDPEPPVHSHTHRVEEQMGGRRRSRDPALAPTRQRSSDSQQVYLFQAYTSLRPGPRAGCHLGESNRGCRIMTEALAGWRCAVLGQRQARWGSRTMDSSHGPGGEMASPEAVFAAALQSPGDQGARPHPQLPV